MKAKQRLLYFAGSFLATLLLLRIYLLFFPSTNLNIGKYNVHHLYIGAFLIVVLLVFFILNIVNKFVMVLAGISSALVLDEIIYLIATDSSDISYLSPVSLFGAIILTAIILIFAIILYKQQKNKFKK